VLEAVALAHSRAIAHRDLRPQHLVLARTAAGAIPKVIDFGIAKAMQEGARITELGTQTRGGEASLDLHP
jgi:eukaryotic-like serine/threonine-protein kinase